MSVILAKQLAVYTLFFPPTTQILWISWRLAQGAVQKSISFQARLHLCSAFRSKDIFVHTYHPVRQEELERPQLHTHKRNHKSSHSKPPQNCVVFTSNTRILLSLPRKVYYQEKVCLILWCRYVNGKNFRSRLKSHLYGGMEYLITFLTLAHA